MWWVTLPCIFTFLKTHRSKTFVQIIHNLILSHKSEGKSNGVKRVFRGRKVLLSDKNKGKMNKAEQPVFI